VLFFTPLLTRISCRATNLS